MNSFAQDQRQFSSGTWDPSQHRRISFPVLEHPNARPEQAPSEGVRELLYQYEAIQAPSTEPLNIFWNDEEETNGLNRRLEEEEEAEMQRVRDRLIGTDPDIRQERRARALCTGTLVVALLLFATSVTVLIVGTVCVFGECGTSTEGEEKEVVDYPWPTETVVYTRFPSAAPTRLQANDDLGGSSSGSASDNVPTNGNNNNNNDEGTPEAESNIFARPTSAPPTLMPTQQPTKDPYLANQTYAPDEATLVPNITNAVDSNDGNSTIPSTSNATYLNSTDDYNATIPIIINGTEVASNATFGNFTTSNATTMDSNELIIVANQSSSNVLMAMELITVMKTKMDTVAGGSSP